MNLFEITKYKNSIEKIHEIKIVNKLKHHKKVDNHYFEKNQLGYHLILDQHESHLNSENFQY